MIKCVKPRTWIRTGLSSVEANRKLIDEDIFRCAKNEHILLLDHGNIKIVRRGLEPSNAETKIEREEFNHLQKVIGRNLNHFTVYQREKLGLVEVEAID